MGFFNKLSSFVKGLFTSKQKDIIDDFTAQEDFTDYEDTTFDESDYTNYDNEDYADQEEIYLQRIREIIDSIKDSHPQAGRWFEQLLNEQIEIYGAKAVAEGLDSVEPSELEMLVIIAYYKPESPEGQSALTKLYMIITSEAPSMDDLKNMEEMVYNDSSWS